MSVNNYLITGPNGVGKTTIIETIVRSHPDHFRHVKGSAVLKDCMGVSSYEELRQFSDEEKNDAFNTAMRARMRASRGEIVDRTNLVDAHLLFFNEGRVTSCVMPWTTMVDGIAVVTVDPEIMLRRICDDAASGTRERSVLPAGLSDQRLAAAMLSGYVTMNSAFASSYGEQYGIPVAEIDNSKSPEVAAARFVEVFMAQPAAIAG